MTMKSINAIDLIKTSFNFTWTASKNNKIISDTIRNYIANSAILKSFSSKKY
jgi:hypothetical protein